MSMIRSTAWWRSTAGALARTALAALAPLVPWLADDPAGRWLPVALTLALAVVLAAATALAGLPDLERMDWWDVALARALRTFGQVVLASASTAVLLSDVPWSQVLPTAAWAALGTAIMAALQAVPSPVEAGDGPTVQVRLVPDLTGFVDEVHRKTRETAQGAPPPAET